MTAQRSDEMGDSSITEGVAVLGLGSFVKIAVSAAIAPVYARALGVDGFGQYAYYLAVILMSSHLCNMGMTAASTRFIAERADDRAWRRRIAFMNGRIHLVFTMLTCALVFHLIRSHSSPSQSFLVIALLVTGTMALNQVFFFCRGVLFALRLERQSVIADMAGMILAGISGVALLLAGAGIAGSLFALLAGHGLSALISVRDVRRVLRVPAKIPHVSDAPHAPAGTVGPDMSDMSDVPKLEMLRFGFSSMLFAAFGMLLYSLDIVILRHASGPVQTGFYAAALQWSQFVWCIPIAVGGVILPASAPLWRQGRLDEITAMVSIWTRRVALTSAPLLLLVAVFSEPILRIYYGSAFSSATDARFALWILMPGAFAMALARVIGPVVHARGKASVLAAVMAVASLGELALCILWAPKWGAIGVAAATSMIMTGVSAAFLILLRRLGVDPFSQFSTSKFAGLCLATGGLFFVIAHVARSAPSIAIPGIIFVILGYGWASVKFGLLHRQEIHSVARRCGSLFRFLSSSSTDSAYDAR